MKKFLVTGGEGFIGRGIIKSSNGISYDIKSGKDILNKSDLLIEARKTEGIFHCAAKISVTESILFPEDYYKNNVIGTEYVISAANENHSKIVFSSSAAVYGDINTIAEESNSLLPMSPYASNKVEGEKLLTDNIFPHVILRYFNVFGPGQSEEYGGVITKFIDSALKDKDLIIFGNGEQVRDFVFIDDVVSANLLAMNSCFGKSEIFNICSSVPVSINELAKTIIKIIDSQSKIIYEPKRAGDISFSLGNYSKAKDLLNWSPKTDFLEGLKKTINYYKSI